MRKAITLMTTVFLLSALAPPLFAKGKKDVPVIHNDTWTLAVTAIETPGLPPSYIAVGDVAGRALVAAMTRVNRRVRLSPEEEYYRNLVWRTAEKAAAKKISDKQNQRAALVYQGLKDWRYRRDIKRIDKELVTLRTELAAAEAAVPVVEAAPVFKLVEQNTQGQFPTRPRENMEYLYCKQQKIDGFVTGDISIYYGRTILTVKMFTMFSRSWTFQERIIFSTVDIDAALDDLSVRLIESAGQTPPASLVVKAEPEDAIIVVNNRFEGRGASARERSAGEAAVEIFADNYGRYDEKFDLSAEEKVELTVRLPPLPLANLAVVTETEEGAAVYRGARYIGQTPLALETPRDRWVQLMAEGGENRTASTALIAGDEPITFKLMPPIEDGAVDKARRGFYGAWGRFWIAVPLYLVINSMSGNYSSALNSALYPTKKDTERADYYRIAAIGAGVAAIGFGAEFVGRLVYYVIMSNRDRTPLSGARTAEPATVEPVQEETDVSLETSGSTETAGSVAPSGSAEPAAAP